jgi:hypothetical protein
MLSLVVAVMFLEAIVQSAAQVEIQEVLPSPLLKSMSSGISLLKLAAVTLSQPLPHASLTQSLLTSTHALDSHTSIPSNWPQIPSSMDGYLMISLPKLHYSEDVKWN